MKIETSAEAIKAAFSNFKGVISPRNTIPILGDVCLQHGKIIGTDLDRWVTVALPGKMTGKACLPWQQINRPMAHVDPDESINIDEKDGLATFTFNGATYTYPSLPTDDFPFIMVEAPDAEKTRIGNAGLAAALRAVSFAISTEETRYYLNGVCFSKNADGDPVVVATDGRRLAVKRLPFEITGATTNILPRGAVDFILSRPVEPQSCEFANVTCAFEWPGVRLDAKLINGTYPDWSRVVPKGEMKHAFVIEPAKWLPALNRMRSLAYDVRGRAIAINVSPETAVLEVNSHDLGSCKETLPIDVIRGEPYRVGFNSRYLVDVLRPFKGCEIVLVETADGSGGPHRFTSPDDDTLTVVLMPMRV